MRFTILGYSVKIEVTKIEYNTAKRLLNVAALKIKGDSIIEWKIALIKSLKEEDYIGLKEAKKEIESLFYFEEGQIPVIKEDY